MFKAAKTPGRGPQKPGIWAEGSQFAPLTAGPLGRVTVILSRRMAARGWRAASGWLSASALALESRQAQSDHPNGGQGGGLSPSRNFAVQMMSRLSRLQAQAAQAVDHSIEPFEPLAFSDLRGFMDQQRATAAHAEREKARKDLLGQMARNRAATLVQRQAQDRSPVVADPSLAFDHDPHPEAKPETPAASRISPQTPSDLAEPQISSPELLAIRAALASVPEIAKPVSPEPAPAVFNPPPRLFHPNPNPMSGEMDLPAPAAAHETPRRTSGTMGKAARHIASALGSVARWSLHRFWQLAGPVVARLSAFCLGWGLVVLCIPVGFFKAIQMHASGQDLRYFD